MKTCIAILALAFLTPTLKAYDQCGKDPKEAALYHLDWVQAGVYQTNSSYANVRGIICAGIARDYSRIEVLNYRDNFGVRVSTSVETLKKKDVPYIRRQDFPAVARLLVRADHPLTVKIDSESTSAGQVHYVASLKFLRNVRKSFGGSDIRDIKVDLVLVPATKQFIPLYNQNRFDEITLSISTGLNITSVIMKENERVVEKINPFNLPRGTRVH